MSQEVVALDAGLARAGEDITIRRKVGTGDNQVNIDVDCRAVVRALRAEQLAGGFKQTDLRVIHSPSEILKAQWPGGVPEHPVAHRTDPRIPRAKDKVIIKGREHQVAFANPIFVRGEWVRMELTVEG